MVSFWSADPVLIFHADNFYSAFKKYGGKLSKGSYYLHKPRSERHGRELEPELGNQIMCITTISARSGSFQLFLFNDLFLAQDDGADEYTYQDDEQDDEYEQDSVNDGYGTRRGRQSTGKGTRRSARNTNSKRAGSSDSALWRGERRSSRLAGTDAPFEEDPPRKRARTEDSQTSAQSIDPPVIEDIGVSNGVRVKTSGAAALKPTEVAMEQIAGRKKSKFWVYAVEPTSEAEKHPSPSGSDTAPPTNGYLNDMDIDADDWDRDV